MLVRERGNDLGFTMKTLQVIRHYLRVQHFDRRLYVQSYVLAEIDIGKTTLPQQPHKAVVSYLLTQTICHSTPSSLRASLSTLASTL